MTDITDADPETTPAAHSRRVTHPGVSTLVLLGFVLLAVAVGMGGALSTSDAVTGWYAEADKPVWTPPSIVFGPVWTALYLMMAVAAWLVWRRRHEVDVRPALGAYFVQLLLNAIWTPVFFGLYPVIGLPALWLAFAIIVALFLAVLFTILRFWPIHRFAAVLLMPYLAWIVYASSLNVAIAAYAS
jgi:tryptophan-rich sensory protein